MEAVNGMESVTTRKSELPAVPQKAPVLRRLPIYILSAFFSGLAVFRLIINIIRVGPNRLFYIKNRLVRPAAIDNPAYGEHRFARLSTLKLHYVTRGPEDKPLMLFVHGFPEFWYSWRHQLVEFGDKFRVVAVDMRGYGESDKPVGVVNYTIDKLVSDIRELIYALGYHDCYLVAHDWGGAVAWSFAQVYPHAVKKLIICNMPHPSALMKVLKTSSEQKKMSWYMAFFQTPWLPEVSFTLKDLAMFETMFKTIPKGVTTSGFTDDDIEAWKYTFSSAGKLTGPLNYYRASVSYVSPLKYPSPKVKVPTLLIWGIHDQALSMETAQLTSEYVEDLTVKYIDTASHWVQQQAPGLVNQYMWEFLGQDPNSKNGQNSSDNDETNSDPEVSPPDMKSSL